MGSGTNRSFWRSFGTRTSRRSNTKSLNPKVRHIRIVMKQRRAEAARRSQP